MLVRAVLLFSVFLSGVANADNYDVQIGAFRDPDAAKIQLPANIGELRSTAGPNGLTRFVVGPFASKAAAERARDELKAAGFAGAFIRATPAVSDTAALSVATPVAAPKRIEKQNGQVRSISQADLDTLSSLSDEERRDLVYLDGQLHKKVGDKFIPFRD